MHILSEFIGNHWELWLAFIVVLIAILITEYLASKKRGTKIDPQSVVAMMNHDNVPVFDLRPLDAFRAGHVLNATRAQKDEFEKDPFLRLKKKPIVLLCDNGILSSQFASELKDKGYNEVYVLNGGMRAWSEADLPVAKGK
jgi:rhodanese-related sulfurtransferase